MEDSASFALVNSILQESILQILLISGPILLVAVIVGLLISIFQATTSIQDQTLTFVPKILVVLGLIGLLGNWMLGVLVNYTIRLMELLPQVANAL